MSKPPSLYVLRGDDSVRYREHIASFKASLGDSDMADLNTTVLDGEGLTIDSLTADAMAVPFLTERRLVIVENGRQFLTKHGKAGSERLLNLFNDLPDSTALFFRVDDQIIKKSGKVYWENAKSYDWLLNWISKNPSRGMLVDCSLPNPADMPNWIKRQVKEKGGEIENRAAVLLAEFVGNDTLRAGHEIDKLLTYRGNEGAVCVEDIELLTTHNQEGDIFLLVDGLGERNGKKAMEHFLLLTEKSDVMELTGMIHRQFRLLIQTREVMDEGGRVDKVQEELKVMNFVAKKLYQQASRFSMAQLIGIHDRLLKIDEDIKTGGLPGILTFQLLIADLTS